MSRNGQSADAAYDLDHVVPLVTPTEPLPATAEVVIIGGGIMGASIAYHLAEAGVRDVLLIERDSLGSGSSAKPLGGVRATFSDAGNVQLGLRSLRAFERFGSEIGADIGLHQVGYLFLCRTEAELAAVEDSVRLQNALGCDSRMITAPEAYELNPFLDPGCLLGASFSPRDGYAEPALVVAGYAAAAARRGARIAEHTEVFDLSTDADGVHRVTTQRGSVRADAVVITAGVWSTGLGAMRRGPPADRSRYAGRSASRRSWTSRIPTVPFTLDLSTTLYFHNYRNGLLLGISNRDEDPGLCREFSYGWTRAFDEAADDRRADAWSASRWSAAGPGCTRTPRTTTR